jgi:FKBP-type peptidyl-prolyl cis-trans isomerase
VSELGAKKSESKKPRINGQKLRSGAQRVIILGAVVAFAVGSVGIYLFQVFMSNNGTDATQQPQQSTNLPVDPNAYTTKAPVTELKITDIKVGDGAEVKAGANVTVNYEGTLASTGQIFDQSKAPVDISLDQVIEGWQKGIPGMKVGGKRQLVIPAAEGYGSQGSGDGTIPANADLVFTVEVTAVK